MDIDKEYHGCRDLVHKQNLTHAASISLHFKEHNSRRERHDRVLFLTRLPHADYNFDIHCPTIIVHNYPLLAAL